MAATTGQGLAELEDALLLQAELLELAASHSRRAEAVVIEARVDRGQGPVATVVVKRGTLKVRAGQGAAGRRRRRRRGWRIAVYAAAPSLPSTRPITTAAAGRPAHGGGH